MCLLVLSNLKFSACVYSELHRMLQIEHELALLLNPINDANIVEIAEKFFYRLQNSTGKMLENFLNDVRVRWTTQSIEEPPIFVICYPRSNFNTFSFL